MFQDIGAVGEIQGLMGILLDEKDGSMVGVNPADAVEEFCHQPRSQAKGGFIKHE
jgi:hypothetical protein